MKVLPMGERVRVVSALVEGTSLRATERMTGVSRPTVTDLLLRVGEGCRGVLDERMRDLHCDVLELDEVWAFVGKKEGHLIEGDPAEFGDQYTWVALDARTKLVPVHRVEKRTTEAANAFAAELRARVLGAPQITTDGLKAYVEAIEAAFGTRVHYAQILKTYAATHPLSLQKLLPVARGKGNRRRAWVRSKGRRPVAHGLAHRVFLALVGPRPLTPGIPKDLRKVGVGVHERFALKPAVGPDANGARRPAKLRHPTVPVDGGGSLEVTKSDSLR